MNTRRAGYEERRDDILSQLGAVIGDGATLDEVYRTMDEVYGTDSHEIWVGLHELDAGGALDSYEDAGKTHLRLDAEDIDTDELDGYGTATAARERERDTRYVAQTVAAPWTDTVRGEPVPTLRRNLLHDFLDRHGWDADLFADGETLGATGHRATAAGDKETRLTVVNDYGAEEDLLRVRMAFHDEPDVFQRRHRESYARTFWTPLTVLQQRTGWINRSADAAAAELADLAAARTEKRRRDEPFTEKAGMVDHLASLAKTEEGASYEDARDAAVEAYYGGGTRPSALLLPFGAEVEHRLDDDGRAEGALPAGSEAGREKGPALLREHLDMVYAAARDR